MEGEVCEVGGEGEGDVEVEFGEVWDGGVGGIKIDLLLKLLHPRTLIIHQSKYSINQKNHHRQNHDYRSNTARQRRDAFPSLVVKPDFLSKIVLFHNC